MVDYASLSKAVTNPKAMARPQSTPQSQSIPGRELDMHRNGAGGFVFTIDDWTRLRRFLILGSEGGTFYATEQALTIENSSTIIRCIKSDGHRVVTLIREVSVGGLAKKQQPSLFALALCMIHGDDETKGLVRLTFNDVVRTGTHLFTIVDYLNKLGGWGKSKRTTIGNWYLSTSNMSLVRQLTKYRGRRVNEGDVSQWTHRDVLRLSHPKAEDPIRNALFAYAVGKLNINDSNHSVSVDNSSIPIAVTQDKAIEYILDVEYISREGMSNPSRVVDLIHKWRLPHEVIPSELQRNMDVAGAIFDNMLPEATIRNLARYTANGLLKQNGRLEQVIDRIVNPTNLETYRIHPLSILSALCVYSQGHGERSSLTWSPIKQIKSALDSAFYLSFKYVEPTYKRVMIALDVSGSMTWDCIAGIPGLTPAKAGAALALVTANVEKEYSIYGFGTSFTLLDIDPSMSLEAVLNLVSKINMGGTDASLPPRYAKENRIAVDLFTIITDNETWAGHIHPSQELALYRESMDLPNTRLASLGMTASDSSIADPNDPLMLDLVGYSSDTPTILSEFARGNL